MQQSQGYAGIRWVKDSALPLDDQPVMLLVLQDESFRGAGYEIGYHAINRDTEPADHDPGLAGGNKQCILAAPL